MTRFTLVIDLDTLGDFDELVGALDSVIDKLKVDAPGCRPADAPSGAGSTIRDNRGRPIGSWEFREG